MTEVGGGRREEVDVDGEGGEVEGGDNRLMGRVTVKKMKSIRQ